MSNTTTCTYYNRPATNNNGLCSECGARHWNTPNTDDRERLYDKLGNMHAQYISDHLCALDKLKPSMSRQYELENEISKIPTKFVNDLVDFIQSNYLPKAKVIEAIDELLADLPVKEGEVIQVEYGTFDQLKKAFASIQANGMFMALKSAKRKLGLESEQT